jgi:poly-gamma-glutamate synthesis protein (capsule biosynthesis protein)
VRALEGALRNVPKPLFEKAPEFFWMVFGGDLMLERGAEAILLGEGPEGIFGTAAPLLHDADFTALNLEGAVSRRGQKAPKTYTFRFSPPVTGALRDAGVDAVLQANNHAFDWGMEAFLDTLDYLEAAGIGVLGAGRSEAEAGGAFVFQKGEYRLQLFGIASFATERSGWDGRSVAALGDRPGIFHARRGGGELLPRRLPELSPGDLKIVLFHGGEEWSSRPDRTTRELYRSLIAAGADLIVGSHPHIVQGFEWVAGKPVFWSLGNLVFSGMDHTGGGDEGLIIRLGYRGKQLVYLEPYPVALSGPRTTLASREQLRGFYRLSRELASRD